METTETGLTTGDAVVAAGVAFDAGVDGFALGARKCRTAGVEVVVEDADVAAGVEAGAADDAGVDDAAEGDAAG